MVRIIFVVCVLIGLASARTLDGPVEGSSDRHRPLPHGLDADYSSVKVDPTKCTDCEPEPETNNIRQEDASKHNSLKPKPYISSERTHSNKRGRHNKRSKNPIDKIKKPFLGISRVRVSVASNHRNSARRHLYNKHTRHQRRTIADEGHLSQQFSNDDGKVTVDLVNDNDARKNTGERVIQSIKSKTISSVDSVDAKEKSQKDILKPTQKFDGINQNGFKNQNERFEIRGHGKSQDEIVTKSGNMATKDAIDLDRKRVNLTLSSAKEKSLSGYQKTSRENKAPVNDSTKKHRRNRRRKHKKRDNKKKQTISKKIANHSKNAREIRKGGKDNNDQKQIKVDDNKVVRLNSKKNKLTSLKGQEQKEDDGSNKQEQPDKSYIQKETSKNKQHEETDETNKLKEAAKDSERRDLDNRNDQNIHGKLNKQKEPVKTDINTSSTKQSKKRNRMSRLGNKSRSQHNTRKGHRQDRAKQVELDIAIPPNKMVDDRWSRQGLDQVPDVERLERRLHPKVEAPVDDIMRSLRKILHQIQHSIFTVDYTYKQAFNTTRWKIMVPVREELMTIAKENDDVYDAVMEVSLHTKQLYLRAHQRRTFSNPSAVSSATTNGMRNIDLRAKYQYARDEQRAAELLKRKIIGLQRKRATLGYDFIELTRKIIEKLPTRELYDLGRRANQTIQTLEYSRAMRDAMDRTHLYRHSQTSTFLDMRSARDHIIQSNEIMDAVKKQYLGNQMKAKEIKRAQQNRELETMMGFDMNHMEQWATVDGAKLHSNDLFNTAAMILMKFKPLLNQSSHLITAIKEGTQESSFEKSMRNIREKLQMLNITMFAIRSDVCTDQYEVCVVKIEEVKKDTEHDGNKEKVKDAEKDDKVKEVYTKGDTEDNLVEEASGDDTDTTDSLDESSGDWIEESSGDGSEIPIDNPAVDDTSEKPPTDTQVVVNNTHNDTKATNRLNEELYDSDDEDIIKEIEKAKKASTNAFKTLKVTTASPVTTRKSKVINDKMKTTGPISIDLSDSDDEYIIEEIKKAKKTKANVSETSTIPLTPVPLTSKTTASTVTTEASKMITNKKTTTETKSKDLSDSDDEDIIEEIEKAKKTTATVPETAISRTTPVPATTTESAWAWNYFGWNQRKKRDAEDVLELLNTSLSELIQDYLTNRTEVNREWNSQARIRLQSVNVLNDHFNKVKTQISRFENKTMTAKSFLSKWGAKAAEFRAVHDRVVDVSKDIAFKFDVLKEQNGKAVKQANAKLKKMQDTYENNKDRINDDSSPETAKQAIELAQKVKDNLSEITSLKTLNPSPCKKLQNMDTMIRANISELRQKIQQAKLIAASLQVAVILEGKSHLELPVQNIETTKQSRMDLEMTIKPTSKSGAIATVQTNDTGAIVISLEDYVPKLTILDDGRYNIEKKSGDIPLQTDSWYRIRLERFATNYNLTVYNSSTLIQSFTTNVDGDDYPTVYNQPNTVFLGGATDKYDLDNWNGCIGNVEVNGQYLSVLNADSQNKIRKSCTILSNNMGQERSLVLDGFGHAFYTINIRLQRSQVSMFVVNFTAQSDGMIFSISAENNRFKAVAVVKDMRLHVTVKHNNTHSSFISDRAVIGSEQQIELSSKDRSVSVTLNGDRGSLISTPKPDVIKVKSNGIQIGAASNKTRSIRGCVHSIRMNNEGIPINSMSEAYSVSYGTCQDTHCVKFDNDSRSIQLPNTTDFNSLAFVFTFGSRGPILQFSKGKKFNIKFLLDQDGLHMNETVNDDIETIYLSESDFNKGDEVVALVTDVDKTLKVTIGDTSEKFNYDSGGGGGGIFSWFGGGNDKEKETDEVDESYSVRIGSIDDSSSTVFTGNLITLRINDRNVDLSPYITTHSIQRCALFRRQVQKSSSPKEERKQLTC